MRAAARARWRCEHCPGLRRVQLRHRSSAAAAADGGGGGGGDSALMSAVLGVDSPENDRRWIRRPLEPIPSPADAS
jgi:hypothetical protein